MHYYDFIKGYNDCVSNYSMFYSKLPPPRPAAPVLKLDKHQCCLRPPKGMYWRQGQVSSDAGVSVVKMFSVEHVCFRREYGVASG